MTALSKLAYAGTLAYALGIRPKSSTPAGYVIKALALFHAYQLFSKRRAKALLLLLVTIPRVTLGRVSAPLIHHFTTWLLLGKGVVGKRLPPEKGLPSTALGFLKRGIWQRHLLEAEAMNEMDSDMMRANFFTTNWRKPVIPVVFVRDPLLVAKVMEDKVAYPSRGRTGFNDFVPKGLLSMPTGEEHSLHRRLVSKFLSESYLATFQNVIREETERLLDLWQAGGEHHVRNLHYDFQMLTLEVIMRCAMGDAQDRQNLKEEDNMKAHDLDYVLKHIVLQTAFPYLKYLPFTGQAKVQRIEARHDQEERETFDNAVVRMENNPDEPATMLSSLWKAMQAGVITRDDVRDELSTIRGAGHETSSNTACWAMIMLEKHPEVMRKVREECDAVFPSERTPTFEQARKLTYTRQVMYETLRLYPTVPSFPRECVQDTTLGGYDIPEGTYVFVSQQALNTRKDVWGEDVMEFRPERFEGIGELAVSKPVGVPNGPAYGFIPFGAGPRTCVGSRLASLEVVTIIASMVKNAEWDIKLPLSEIEPVADVTLGPKLGLPATCRLRVVE